MGNWGKATRGSQVPIPQCSSSRLGLPSHPRWQRRGDLPVPQTHRTLSAPCFSPAPSSPACSAPTLPRAVLGSPRTPKAANTHTGCGAEGPHSTRGRSPPPSRAAGRVSVPRGHLEGKARPRYFRDPSSPTPVTPSQQPPLRAPSGRRPRPRPPLPPPAAAEPAARRPPPARRYLGVGAELGRLAGADQLGRGLQVDGGALRRLRGAAAQPAVEVRRHHRDGSLGRQDGDGQALPGAAAGAPAAAGCLEERRDAAGFGAAAGAAAHQHGRGAAPHRQLLPGERSGERSGIVTRRAATGPRSPPAPAAALPPGRPSPRGRSAPALPAPSGGCLLLRFFPWKGQAAGRGKAGLPLLARELAVSLGVFGLFFFL